MERWTQNVSRLYWSCYKGPHSVRNQQMSGPSLVVDFICTKYPRLSAPDEDPAGGKVDTQARLCLRPLAPTHLPEGCCGRQGSLLDREENPEYTNGSPGIRPRPSDPGAGAGTLHRPPPQA